MPGGFNRLDQRLQVSPGFEAEHLAPHDLQIDLGKRDTRRSMVSGDGIMDRRAGRWRRRVAEFADDLAQGGIDFRVRFHCSAARNEQGAVNVEYHRLVGENQRWRR